MASSFGEQGWGHMLTAGEGDRMRREKGHLAKRRMKWHLDVCFKQNSIEGEIVYMRCSLKKWS